jgi:hypothetical protein
MSSIDSNYGMESLNVAMMKRSSDNQGKMALQLLEGAAESVATARANAPAAPALQSEPVTNVVEGSKGANVNTYA